MDIYTSDQDIRVIRREIINSRVIAVGDQIEVGKYTATCQRVAESGAVFLLDQYLDKPYTHNDLIPAMNAFLAKDSNFDDIRQRLTNWIETNGTEYPFRVPYAGELFSGTSEDEWMREYYEPDTPDGFKELWPLMAKRTNRIADREGEAYEWGWLMNKVKDSAATFARVYAGGRASHAGASASYGVRPAFCLI